MTPHCDADAKSFFRSLGSPQLIVAPMVDQSERAFRMLCRRHGAQLCFTPMLHSRLFATEPKYRRENWDPPCPEDRPLIAQFCGNDPATFLTAAQLVQHEVDAIDVNLGCPQGIARRGHYGAFLLDEWELLHAIVATLSAGLAVPVTCKVRLLRSGLDDTVRLCRLLVAAGARMLTVHGRRRDQIGPRAGAADWAALRVIKEALRPTGVPVVANGGVADATDVLRCLAATGCDGVMSSEAVLENPALFSAAAMAAAAAKIYAASEVSAAAAAATAASTAADDTKATEASAGEAAAGAATDALRQNGKCSNNGSCSCWRGSCGCGDCGRIAGVNGCCGGVNKCSGMTCECTGSGSSSSSSSGCASCGSGGNNGAASGGNNGAASGGGFGSGGNPDTVALAGEYLALTLLHPPRSGCSESIVRAHLFKMLHGVFALHTDLRDCLSASRTHADIRAVYDEAARRHAAAKAAAAAAAAAKAVARAGLPAAVAPLETAAAAAPPSEAAAAAVAAAVPGSWYMRHRARITADQEKAPEVAVEAAAARKAAAEAGGAGGGAAPAVAAVKSGLPDMGDAMTNMFGDDAAAAADY